jgi:hypothetical protein
MNTTFNIFNFDSNVDKYELIPHQHNGRDGFIIESTTHESTKVRDSIFSPTKEGIIQTLFNVLFSAQVNKGYYRTGKPRFNVAELFDFNADLNRSYSIALTGNAADYDIIFDTLVDKQLKKQSY